MMEHPLDRPIWSALATRHAHFREGSELAMRYPSDVSPFVAGRDASPEAVAAMVALIGEGEEISMVEVAPPHAPADIAETRLPLFQMVWDKFPGAPKSAFDIQPLGEADAADMLALATLTRPGPFRGRTHTMGRFFGVREAGRLIAMAGERLHAPGFHEISAVCTHPDHRGRGLGAALMRKVGARILEEGDQPFLHTYASNATAIALYRKLGFEVRAELTHAMWKRG
jgi:ribosomal protein S18 acetylase RimI-like enzyme